MLDGTYRPDRHGPLPAHLKGSRIRGAKPTSLPTAPPPEPPDLSGKAKELWDAVAASGVGLVESDKAALSLLCSWWVDIWQCEEDLKTADVTTRRQLLSAKKIASDAWDKLAGRFGLTPSDRAKIMADARVEEVPKVESRPKTKKDGLPPPKLKIAGA